MKNFRVFLLVFIITAVAVENTVAQDITTAGVFFSKMSEKYGAIRDYTANIAIKSDTTYSTGNVLFKRPSQLRIDFTRPKNQVIVFTGDRLIIHLPRYPAITLSQSVSEGGNGGASMATPEGLSLLRRAYSIAYETGAAAVPLEEGSSERVVVLALNRRSVNETFRTIRLSVLPDSKLIRRIEAWTLAGTKVTFDFWNYRLNGGIPDIKFLYDVPPEAPTLDNFLFLD